MPSDYLTEVASELRKVVWPTSREVRIATLIVLIAVVVMAAVIFVFDYTESRMVLNLFD